MRRGAVGRCDGVRGVRKERGARVVGVRWGRENKTYEYLFRGLYLFLLFLRLLRVVGSEEGAEKREKRER